jgi:hypothetical protein
MAARGAGLGVLVLAAVSLGSVARADTAPALVMPNPRGIPPIVDGFDATGAIIEGDWGLARPGAGTVMIYRGPVRLAVPPEPAGYFPATGRRPRYGRDEVLPRTRPRPAQSYRRSWSTDFPGRSTISAVPAEPPPVIEAWPGERFKRPRPRRSR